MSALQSTKAGPTCVLVNAVPPPIFPRWLFPSGGSLTSTIGPGFLVRLFFVCRNCSKFEALLATKLLLHVSLIRYVEERMCGQHKDQDIHYVCDSESHLFTKRCPGVSFMRARLRVTCAG
jgi:hypothetical protein